MVEYLKSFAQSRGLECSEDSVHNVLIRKSATKGREHDEPIILQSHIDMVCENNNGVKHDFEKDPIEVYVDGSWVMAKETTLGADDGIGVAAQLAILNSSSVSHPALECLFTVEEETGLTGAINLKAGWLKGNRLVNLDSEDDGVFCIGCAGGIGTVAEFEFKEEKVENGLFFFNLAVNGLKGGHSGEDIEKERGNSIKILSRFLYRLSQEMNVRLANIFGGNLHNAIPREASALVGVDFDKKERVRVLLNTFVAEIEDELPSETDFKMELESAEPAPSIIDADTTQRLIRALCACPHGVIAMSRDIEGLVETSTNLASIKTEGRKIVVGTSQRSSVESKKHEIKERVSCVFLLSGAKVTIGDGYPGWKPNLNSKIKDEVVDAYERLFGVKPVVQAIHAGLECGLILEKYPNMDMISIGPTIVGNHSPAEKMSIPTVEKFWKHLVEILATAK